MNQNAPRTLGTILGGGGLVLAAFVIAFFGQDWTTEQIVAVNGVGGFIGAIVGYLAGDRTQKTYTVPRDPTT